MKRILLIDDNDQLREEVVTVFEVEGFVVDTAPNGRVALERIAAERPDLVVCDVMMPEMDGYETLKAIRSNPETETLPVLLLTARDLREHMRRGMELGADDYITKPFKIVDLLKAVRVALEKRDRLERRAATKLEQLREQVALALPHELRTPLACIMGYAEILADAGDQVTAQDVAAFAQNILGAGQRLNRMSENTLLYVQLELLGQGHGDVKADASRVRTRLDEIVARRARDRAVACGRSTDLLLDLTEVTVTVGPAYVTKVVDEITDNAFKFSEPGTPVRVWVSTDGGFGRLRVADAGRGMTVEQIEAVGGFVQFERSLREQQGLGLGLSIARRVALVWGGTLSIESTVGAGTTVAVTLPRPEAGTHVARTTGPAS